MDFFLYFYINNIATFYYKSILYLIKMPDAFHINLDPTIKLIAKIFANYDESEIKKGKSGISQLRPIIYDAVNKMLDFLNEKRKVDLELEQELKNEKYIKVLQILEKNIRY